MHSSPDPKRNQKPDVSKTLPALHYHSMKDSELRKKLMEIGIPFNGSRSLIQRRHTEWLDLVRANCDSDTPKNGQTLLKELAEWERTQGDGAFARKTADEAKKIMDKGWNANGWSSAHNEDFRNLVTQARKGIKAPERNGNDESTPDKDERAVRDDSLG